MKVCGDCNLFDDKTWFCCWRPSVSPPWFDGVTLHRVLNPSHSADGCEAFCERHQDCGGEK
jgi:hypothetical protein